MRNYWKFIYRWQQQQRQVVNNIVRSQAKHSDNAELVMTSRSIFSVVLEYLKSDIKLNIQTTKFMSSLHT